MQLECVLVYSQNPLLSYKISHYCQIMVRDNSQICMKYVN